MRPGSLRLALILAGLAGAPGCGGEKPPIGAGPWLVERPWAAAPRSASPRASAGNVSRAHWTPGPLDVELDPQPGARVELELSRAEAGEPPRDVVLVLERRGERRRIDALALGPERPGPRPWQRFRFPLDGVRSGKWKLAFEVDGESLASAHGWVASAPRIVQRREVEPRPSVLCIAIDTLRADYLGCYGHDRPTSPAIDALAAQGIRFERAISQASWTLSSFASLFSGRDPESHGVVHVDQRFGDAFVSFVELFAAAGYATGAVVSGTFTDSCWGFDQGFDDYDDLGMVQDDDAREPGDPTDISAMERRAHKRVTSPEVTEKALRWLEEHRDRRFLLFAHYFDPHYEYLEHPGVSERFPPRPAPGATEVTLADRMRAAYEGEIAFTDKNVGELLAGLEALGLARETIVVLQSDHGEAFEEHGAVLHGSNLHNEQVWVPLVMRVPWLAPRSVPLPVGVLDIGPTLLDLCGIARKGPWQGSSLAPLLRGGRSSRSRPVSASLYGSFAPGAGQRGSQLGYRVDEGGASFLGDLRPGRRRRTMFDWRKDRAQTFDLARAEPARALRVEKRYLTAREKLWNGRSEPEPLSLGAETLEALQALGYAGEGEGRGGGARGDR